MGFIASLVPDGSILYLEGPGEPHVAEYLDGLVLLQWHDAFMTDPMYLSRSIGDKKVAEFAARLASSFSGGWAWVARTGAARIEGTDEG